MTILEDRPIYTGGESDPLAGYLGQAGVGGPTEVGEAPAAVDHLNVGAEIEHTREPGEGVRELPPIEDFPKMIAQAKLILRPRDVGGPVVRGAVINVTTDLEIETAVRKAFEASVANGTTPEFNPSNVKFDR